MTGEADRRATVLVVEDEPNLLNLFEVWLAEDYRIRTATGGAEALNRLDDRVDVLILDRRMPDLSGDELLAELREADCSYPVALVSAAEPDFDLLDLSFDAHLSKPVSRGELLPMVSRLVAMVDVDPEVRALAQRLVKRDLLEANKNIVELDAHNGFAALEAEIETAVACLDGEQVAAARQLVG